MENRFNLIDEPWIPVVDAGRVSLREIFSRPELRGLGGNPVQKIALMKLLLAIAQASVTPTDDDGWIELGTQGLANRCIQYLNDWHDRFYLYGERPFLQLPKIAAAAVQSYGAVLPEISSGNTTVLNQTQVERELDDADRTLLLVTLMAFALSGKKTDNSINLTPGYQGKVNDKGKPSSSKAGPAIGFLGLLHNFLIGESIQQSLWLNLLTSKQIEQAGMYPMGVGIPPWEQMPEGEDCQIARNLKQSLMGRLIPLCRFCLLADEGLHYSEGLAHPGYKDGVIDPSAAVNYIGKEPKALWVDPEKRPWRELTALLSFIGQSGPQGFQSWQIRFGLDRARDAAQSIGIWSGGLRVSSNAGEQYVSGSDDFVESLVWLHTSMLGEKWFAQLKIEMDCLDELAKSLYGRVMHFFKDQKADGGKIAARASNLFWQYCERDFQALVDCCGQDEPNAATRQILRRRFANYVQSVYDQLCPKETARQLDAWAKFRPNNSKYLQHQEA